MNKFTIIRDTREQPDNGWIFEPSEYCNGTEIGTLKTADYSIKGLVDIFAIERKRNTSEFAKNITESRFENELDRLNKILHAFVVLEFDFSDIMLFPMNSGIPKFKWPHLRITSQFILKKFNDYQVKYDNIKFIFGGNMAKHLVEDLCKRVYLKYQNKINYGEETSTA